MQTQETLTYLRVAKEETDGKHGFVYLHRKGNHSQELIFNDAQEAEDHRNLLNIQTPHYANIKNYSI